MSINEFKLACINIKHFTDQDIAIKIPSVHMETDEEVTEYKRVLRKYRPNLAKTFFDDEQI